MGRSMKDNGKMDFIMEKEFIEVRVPNMKANLRMENFLALVFLHGRVDLNMKDNLINLWRMAKENSHLLQMGKLLEEHGKMESLQTNNLKAELVQ